MVDSKPLIVCGIPRTGTTITAQLLNTHPKINMTVENRVIWATVMFLSKLSCSYPQLDNPFSVRMSNVEDFLRVKNNLVEGLRNGIRNYYGECEYFGDKFPHYLFRLNTLNLLFPDAKYIVTDRESESDIKESWLNQEWSSESSPSQIDNLIIRGKAIIERVKNKENVFILSLDELKKDPQKITDELAKFLGLENQFDITIVRRE